MFVIFLSKSEQCPLLDDHLTLQLVMDTVYKLLLACKQNVVAMPPTYRWFCTVHVEAWIAHPDLMPDRTDLGIREVVPFMSGVSCSIERSKKLPNHAWCCVLIRQGDIQLSYCWWMEMCSGYVQHEQLDVQLPSMAPSAGLNPVKNILQTFQGRCGRERALHERILPPKLTSNKS